MIGGGWDGDEPMIRPEQPAGDDRTRRVCVVTGSRAEYGLLRPVMRAIQQEPGLELLVVAAGSHLIPPARTFRDVKADFHVADSVPMQVAGRRTRFDDAEALGKGIGRFARSFVGLDPDWVVVLGDRIEAFAAASAASVAGIAVAHIHGGDRAEGVADEAMRHAITKLAHVHLPATEQSAERIRRMGEPRENIHLVGSPAIDELAAIEPLSNDAYAELGSPGAVLLMHPVGRHDEEEELFATHPLDALDGVRTLALHPNQDPGRVGVMRAIEARKGLKSVEHLPRDQFVGLLKRLAESGGLLVGNSSAALIEAAALQLPAVDIGPRQSGRERPANVVHAERETAESIAEAIRVARGLDRSALTHPYGDGRTGPRVARVLASIDPASPRLLRKHNAY